MVNLFRRHISGKVMLDLTVYRNLTVVGGNSDSDKTYVFNSL